MLPGIFPEAYLSCAPEIKEELFEQGSRVSISLEKATHGGMRQQELAVILVFLTFGKVT